MNTYTISLASGQELSLRGDGFEVFPESGMVQLHSGSDTYNFFRESILYWTVSQDLTKRQLKVLCLLATGKTRDAIARELGYSDSTIRIETIAIYRSLGVSGRDEAVRAGIDNGLIRFDGEVEKEKELASVN